MKILVTGSREFDDYDLLEYTLDILPIDFIVVGDARGADHLTRQYAKEKHLECQVFYANWEEHGKAAGAVRNQHMLDTHPVRNQHMLDTHPDVELVVAFPTRSSVGTWDMIDRAVKAEIEVQIKHGHDIQST
jgi:hypothetical protein